jgi:class 3 adenylate cyclase
MADTVGINVVFTDLVGSTELSSRLGPEATDALRIVHFGLLRSAMAGHDGREVKNLGDGLMVVFPSLDKAWERGCMPFSATSRRTTTPERLS